MQKVMVIGWDCSDFRLIDPWLKEGYLPNLQKLMNISKHGILRSINPPVTPIAWSTIVTGKNPGKHGISGFMSFRNNSYKTYPVNASDRHAKDVWELIGDYGKKVAIVGVPLTFPLRKVNGCMISGFLTPNESVDYCYPKELKQEILTKIPGFAVTPSNFSRNFSDFSSERHDDESVKSVFSILQKHIEAMIYIAKEKEWDFLMGVFNETDWVQHRFWSCIDKSHPKYDEKRANKYRDVIRDVHIRLDEALGELLKQAGDANILIISDHGVGPLYWNINTNYLLYKMGKLTFKRTPQSGARFILARLGFSSSRMITLMRKLQLSFGLDAYVEEAPEMHGENERRREDKSDSVRNKSNSAGLTIKLAKSLILSVDDVDWTKSIAFARVGHGEIYLNREHLFPKGFVKDSDYMKVRTEVIEELRRVKNGGHPVMEEVYRKEDLFNGQYFDQCPDIQLQPVEGYVSIGGFTFGLKNPFIAPETSYAGHHSLNGIFVIREKGYESSARTIEGASLLDVVPTILHLMQLPIPEDLDGKSFADNPQKPSTAQIKVEDASGPSTAFEYSKREEEDLEERLRSLGYI